VSARLIILNPCAKRWTDLRERGSRSRFCDSCQTDVLDLDRYSTEEIDAIQSEATGRVCGYLRGESPAPPRSRRAILVGAILTAISPLMAQSGRVRIRVTDATGATVPSAEASLLGDRDQKLRTLPANAEGEIVFTDLPIGDVRFLIMCQGFMSLTITATIRNEEEMKLGARLDVGAELPGNFSRIKKRKRWWIF